MVEIPTFCPECGEIHQIVPRLSYPSATVKVDGKETS